MTLPYIGAKISLTSNCLFRYEGILAAVDPVEATITLEEVKLFGTEGRKPGQEVPASEQVYELVVFRSGDIKDLEIYEKEPEPKVEEPAYFVDPAIVQHASSTLKFGSHDASKAPSVAPAVVERVAPAIAAVNNTPKHHQQPSYSDLARQNRTADDYVKPTFREENNNSQSSIKPVIREKSVAVAGTATSAPQTKRPSSYASAVISDGPGRFRNVSSAASASASTSTSASAAAKEKEYQFSSVGLQRPDDLEVKPSDGHESFYDKSTSFFDNISSQVVAESITAREGGEASRQHHYHGHHQASTEYRNERHMNMDTFGMAAPPEQPYHQAFRGRGRGGRGGRGGYRGGSRGGSSSYYSNNNNNPNTNYNSYNNQQN